MTNQTESTILKKLHKLDHLEEDLSYVKKMLESVLKTKTTGQKYESKIRELFDQDIDQNLKDLNW